MPFRRACLAAILSCAGLAPAGAQDATYTNPLALRLADGSLAESCADPSLLRDRTTSPTVWYMYCTMDPVSHKERDGKGWKFRMMPVYRSVDLVNWYFVRDAFDTRPLGVAGPTSGLWAPELVYQNGSYYLYFTVTDVADAHSPAFGPARPGGRASKESRTKYQLTRSTERYTGIMRNFQPVPSRSLWLTGSMVQYIYQTVGVVVRSRSSAGSAQLSARLPSPRRSGKGLV